MQCCSSLDPSNLRPCGFIVDSVFFFFFCFGGLRVYSYGNWLLVRAEGYACFMA